MQSHQRLTDQEIRTLFTLLHRYVMTEMDQFELWKFDTVYGKTYVEISNKTVDYDEAYLDVTHLIDRTQ